MSEVMDEEQIKRWTARSKSALVLEIIQGKTTVAAARLHFLPPSELQIQRRAQVVDEGAECGQVGGQRLAQAG